MRVKRRIHWIGNILLPAAAFVWLALQMAACFYLRQDWAIERTKRVLLQAAASYDFQMEIGRIRPAGGLGIEISGFALRDLRQLGRPAVIRVNRVYLRFSLLGLLRSPRHPESALAEIALDQPVFDLARRGSGAGWWDRFRSTSSRRYFRPLVRLRQARIEGAGALFGRDLGRLRVAGASFDLGSLPRLRGWAEAATDLDPALRLAVEADYDLSSGRGSVRLSWEGAELARWQKAGWLPAGEFQVRAGTLAGRAELALGSAPGLRTATFRLMGARIDCSRAGWPVLAVDGRFSLSNRLLRVARAELRTAKSRATIQGRLDLNRPDPSLSGRLVLASLELAEFARLFPGLKARGRAGGRLTLGGTLSRPSLEGSLSLSADASFPPWPPLAGLSLKARFLGEVIAVDSLSTRIGGAAVEGRGIVRLFSSPRLEMDFAARAVKVQDVLAPLELAGGRGELDLEGRLVSSPGEWGLDAEAVWREAGWRGKPLPAGRARVALAGGKEAFRITVAGVSGRGRFEANLRRMEGGWRGEARLEEMALAPLAPFLPQAFRDLAGRATGVMGWRRIAGRNELVFSGKADDLVLAGRRFDELQANLTSRGAEIVVETGQIQAGGGGASFHGRFNRRNGKMQFDLLAHLLPLELIDPQAEGWMEGRLEVEGSWPDDMEGRGWLRLGDLAWRDIPLGAVRAELSLAGERLALHRCRLETPGGEMDLAGTIALSGRKELALEGRFDLDMEPWSSLLPGPAALRGRMMGKAHLLGTLEEAEAAVELRAGAGTVYGTAWDSAEAGIHWRKGRLSIAGGVIRGLGTAITVAGEIDGDGYALSAELNRMDLRAVSASWPRLLPGPFRDLSGHATVKAVIEGPLAHPSVFGEILVEKPALRGWNCPRMAGRFHLAGRSLFLPQLTAADGDRLYNLSGRIDLSRQIVDLELGMDRGDLPGLLGLVGFHFPWPAKGSVSGSLEISGSLTRPAVEGSLRLEEGKLAGLDLHGEMAGRYDGSTFVCERLRLASGEGRLAAAGRLAAQEVEWRLEADDLSLGELLRLFGREERIEGRGDLRFSLHRRAGTLRGEFSFTAGSGLMMEGFTLDRAVVEGSVQGRTLILTRAELVAAGRPLSLAGRLPLPPGFGPLDAFLSGLPPDEGGLSLKLEGARVPLGIFNPVLEGLAEFRSGELSLDAEVSGTWERPLARGTVHISNGSGSTSLLPEAFSRLNLELALEGERMRISQAGLRLGPGWAALSGSVGLSPAGPRYDLAVKGAGIAYKNPAFFDGRIADLDLLITGGPLPSLRGSLTVSDTSITAGASQPGPRPPALPLQVRVVAGRGTRFFLPGVVDLPLSGEVRMGGTLAAPTLSGAVKASSGVIFVYGERFEVASALGTFSPERGYLPYVELEGRKRIRGIDVFVKIHGEVAESGLTVNLWSEPALGREEILNLLSWADLPQSGGGGRLFATGMELVLETVFGGLSEGFRRLIDVDQFRFSLDEQTGSFRLKLGKYVLEELYLSYEILFDDFGTKIWSFDYRLNRSLVLSGLFGNTGEAPRWTLSYQLQF